MKLGLSLSTTSTRVNAGFDGSAPSSPATHDSMESFTADGNDGFAATNSSGAGFAGWANSIISGTSGQTLTATFNITLTGSASPVLGLRTGSLHSSTIVGVSSPITTSGSKTVAIVATANFVTVNFSDADIGGFTVSNFRYAIT